MSGFVENAILWTLALYGLFEIIKTIIYICTYKIGKECEADIIIAAKNQEQNIEGMLRSIIFRILNEKETFIDKIILTDLNSRDNTKEILKKLSEDYECVRFVENIDLVRKLDKDMN